MLDEKSKNQLLRQLSVIQNELIELTESSPSSSKMESPPNGDSSNSTSEEMSLVKDKLQALIELCNPHVDNLKLPDTFNEFIAKIKHLEDLLSQTKMENKYLEQKNYSLEEDLDHQIQDNKQSREQLSVYVDKLRLALNETRQQNELLKDRIETLEDEIQQSNAVNKYDRYQLDKFSREIEQIEDQKVEVQKKYDQVLLEFWGEILINF